MERSHNGIAWVQACLSPELIGPPIIVHENIEHTLPYTQAQGTVKPVDLTQHPEFKDALQDAIKSSYLKSIDQPIPMLGDESPRTCAGDPDKRHRAIEWVRYLEDMDSQNAPVPHDFSWLWKELGLEEHR